jgi:hypothetical protein
LRAGAALFWLLLRFAMLVWRFVCEGGAWPPVSLRGLSGFAAVLPGLLSFTPVLGAELDRLGAGMPVALGFASGRCSVFLMEVFAAADFG